MDPQAYIDTIQDEPESFQDVSDRLTGARDAFLPTWDAFEINNVVTLAFASFDVNSLSPTQLFRLSSLIQSIWPLYPTHNTTRHSPTMTRKQVLDAYPPATSTPSPPSAVPYSPTAAHTPSPARASSSSCRRPRRPPHRPPPRPPAHPAAIRSCPPARPTRPRSPPGRSPTVPHRRRTPPTPSATSLSTTPSRANLAAAH